MPVQFPKEYKIREFPWYIRYNPMSQRAKAAASYPTMYFRKDVLENLRSKNPLPLYESLIIHEVVHLERQKKMDNWKYILKYIFRRSFRFNEELLAYSAQMTYIKKHNLEFDVARYADSLSKIYYLWSTSYDNAYRRLSQAWKNA